MIKWALRRKSDLQSLTDKNKTVDIWRSSATLCKRVSSRRVRQRNARTTKGEEKGRENLCRIFCNSYVTSIISLFLLRTFLVVSRTTAIDFGLFPTVDIATSLLATTGPIITIINELRMSAYLSSPSNFLATCSGKVKRSNLWACEWMSGKQKYGSIDITIETNCPERKITR